MAEALAAGAFADLAGQDAVVAQLQKAADAAARLLAGEPRVAGGMTHAWLFTGPPGSGRSVAARAFAAALLCPDGGCEAGSEVAFYLIQDGGHAWPGGERIAYFLDPPSKALNATYEIWNFFSTHSKP